MNSSAVLGVILLLIGLFMFLFISIVIGVTLIVIGLIMIYFRRRNAAKTRQLESMRSPPAAPASTVIIQREVVKVPCKYCGTLNDLATSKVCSNCGAPLN